MSTIDPGAGVSAPEASPSSAGAPGVPGSPPDGRVGAPPAPSPESQGLRQLREQYEATKSQLEPWTKLGAKPEEVSRSHQAYQHLYSEASRIGKALGYEDAEIHEALATNPVRTLDILREQASKANNGQPQQVTLADIKEHARREAEKLLEPFKIEREQQLEQRATHVFEGELANKIKTSFPNGVGPKMTKALEGVTWSLLQDSEQFPGAFQALRNSGDVRPMEKAFEQAKSTILDIIVEWNQSEKERIGGQNNTTRTPPPPPPKGPRTFRDIAAALNDESIPLDQAFGRS